MDRKQNGFWIASVSIVGAIIVFSILILSIDSGLGVRGVMGNASYDDLLSCITFQYHRAADAYLIVGSVILYFGFALAIADGIFVWIKRSPRFIIMAIAGVFAFVVCDFSLQNLYYANTPNLPGWYYGWTLASVIIMGALGLGAFVVTFVFGRKLLKMASD